MTSIEVGRRSLMFASVVSVGSFVTDRSEACPMAMPKTDLEKSKTEVERFNRAILAGRELADEDLLRYRRIVVQGWEGSLDRLAGAVRGYGDVKLAQVEGKHLGQTEFQDVYAVRVTHGPRAETSCGEKILNGTAYVLVLRSNIVSSVRDTYELCQCDSLFDRPEIAFSVKLDG